MKKMIIIFPKKRKLLFKSICLAISIFLAILIFFNNIHHSKSNILIPINNNISQKLIKGVPILCQFPNLPTGCESTCAAMLLNWLDVSVTKEEIANLISKGDRPHFSSGKLIGGNPEHEFVGDPFSSSGFGTYHKPIDNIINHYLPGKSLDLTGCSFDELLENITDNRPVIIWATVNMQTPSVKSLWRDKDGNIILWKSPEHAMVLIGYTSTEVIVNDPFVGKQVTYNRSIFEKIWVYMGRQAISVQ